MYKTEKEGIEILVCIVGGYGLKKGYRGRFGIYLPPLMEALGLAEVEHNPKNNRMCAL